MSDSYKANVAMITMVCGKYSGVKPPDYIINGQRWDLKEINGSSKDAIRNAIHKKSGQADNFIIDISNCPIVEDDIKKQIENVFTSDNTRFVNRIMLIKELDVIKMYERKK